LEIEIKSAVNAIQSQDKENVCGVSQIQSSQMSHQVYHSTEIFSNQSQHVTERTDVLSSLLHLIPVLSLDVLARLNVYWLAFNSMDQEISNLSNLDVQLHPM